MAGDVAAEAGGAIARPRVFLDVSLGTEPIGRIVVELFVDHTPKTCENFRSLCTASHGPELSYKLSVFHRIIDEFMIQGGDVTKGDGTGGKSIYGEEFEDENLGWRDIDKEGLVCMANRGKDTNNSQFFITLAPCPHLNSKHTVFGQVVTGQNTLERMAKVRVDKNDRPVEQVILAYCGELERRKKDPAAAAVNGQSRESRADDVEDHRGRKRRRRDGGRHDESDQSSSSSRSDEPEHSSISQSRRHRHAHRHRRHDRSISHDANLRGRSRIHVSSRSTSPAARNHRHDPRYTRRSRSPVRHHDGDSVSRSPRRHHRYGRHRSYRSRSRSGSHDRRRYRRRSPSPYESRPDEALIRQEEEEREFGAGADRFEGVIEPDEDEDYRRHPDERDGRDRYAEVGASHYQANYGRSGGHLGGGGRSLGEGAGIEDGDGVKFKGRGSMKFREKRRW